MRLIDADAFDKFLESAEVEAHRIQRYVFASALNTIRGNLREFPTADPVVRCKECVYWSSKETRYCNMLKGTFQENDYCSYGERKGADE